ncbi:MAG: YbaN family protein [Planctomycetaceae bacterium]|nr:YbaN family protein [Planctomycetaceae bacterium]
MKAVFFGCLGFLFVGLAAVGAVVPVMPSTPFLLLASACFVRSSPHLRTWLYRSPLFGPALEDWDTHQYVRPATKVKAFGMLALSGTVTVGWSQLSPWAWLGLALALSSAGLIVWRLPSAATPVVKRDLPLPGGIPQ